MPNALFLVAAVVLAYLLGSVPFAMVSSRLFGLADPRSYGSKNPGATNVLRSGNKKAAIVTLLGDLTKGWLAVFLVQTYGSRFGLGSGAVTLVALAVFFGHLFPIFLNFRGGKGVATALGTMLPIGFAMGGAVITTWLLVLLVSGYSSLASIVTVLLTPLFTYLLKPEYTLPVSLLSCLILIRHHENITRLLKGEESRLWGRRGAVPPAEVMKMDDAAQKRDERDEK